MSDPLKASNKGSLIDICREVVANKAYAEVDGVLLDLYTASAIVQVHDGFKKDSNRQDFASRSLENMSAIAFYLIRKQRES